MPKPEKAKELARFLNTLLPHDHTIDFAMHTSGELHWPDSTMKPEGWVDDAKGYYLFWARAPQRQVSITITAEALEALPPVAIWEVTKEVFPASDKTPSQITVWLNGDHAELV
jgi:hypothetical protein